MKTAWKYVAAAIIVTVILSLMVALDVRSSNVRSERTCSGIKVEFADQKGLDFVTEKDVRKYVDEVCGTCSGKRVEELDLAGIEAHVDGKSAVKKSEVYVTKDGVLHVMISQREPVVRFSTPSGGWYSDEDGYLFPLQKNYTSRVPIVDGNVPVRLPGKDFSGVPSKAAERMWLQGIIGLVDYLSTHRQWNEAVTQIHVDGRGRIILVPRRGKEKFIFGRPEDMERKFAKIEDYYRYIVPEKGEGYYSTVNVSYDGQIVCRK